MAGWTSVPHAHSASTQFSENSRIRSCTPHSSSSRQRNCASSSRRSSSACSCPLEVSSDCTAFILRCRPDRKTRTDVCQWRCAEKNAGSVVYPVERGSDLRICDVSLAMFCSVGDTPGA